MQIRIKVGGEAVVVLTRAFPAAFLEFSPAAFLPPMVDYFYLVLLMSRVREQGSQVRGE